MRKFALPCIVSLLVGALYNIVDQIFIANADYLGSFGNAANSVVFPMTVIALAIATMIGDGCCAFTSINLGAKRPEKAEKGVGNAIFLLVSSGIVLAAIYLIFADPILKAFGATVNEETFEMSREYFFWIALGVPFYMFGQGLNPIIRSDGSPTFAMISLLAGAVCNCILDPIFIYTFKWGMAGAAIATVLGQIVSAILAFVYLFRLKTIKLKKSGFRLAAGCIPIVGHNVGAGRNDRVLELMKKMMFAEAAIGLVATLIFELFPQPFVNIFGASGESVYYTEFAIKCIRLYLCTLTLSCVNKGSFIFLQSLGNAVGSTLLSLLREVGFGVGLVLLLPVWFGLDGVLYFMAVGDVLTFIAVAVALVHTAKDLKRADLTAKN